MPEVILTPLQKAYIAGNLLGFKNTFLPNVSRNLADRVASVDEDLIRFTINAYKPEWIGLHFTVIDYVFLQHATTLPPVATDNPNMLTTDIFLPCNTEVDGKPRDFSIRLHVFKKDKPALLLVAVHEWVRPTGAMGEMLKDAKVDDKYFPSHVHSKEDIYRAIVKESMRQLNVHFEEKGLTDTFYQITSVDDIFDNSVWL